MRPAWQVPAVQVTRVVAWRRVGSARECTRAVRRLSRCKQHEAHPGVDVGAGTPACQASTEDGGAHQLIWRAVRPWGRQGARAGAHTQILRSSPRRSPAAHTSHARARCCVHEYERMFGVCWAAWRRTTRGFGGEGRRGPCTPRSRTQSCGRGAGRRCSSGALGLRRDVAQRLLRRPAYSGHEHERVPAHLWKRGSSARPEVHARRAAWSALSRPACCGPIPAGDRPARASESCLGRFFGSASRRPAQPRPDCGSGRWLCSGSRRVCVRCDTATAS